jgi:hypothetical protein
MTLLAAPRRDSRRDRGQAANVSMLIFADRRLFSPSLTAADFGIHEKSAG